MNVAATSRRHTGVTRRGIVGCRIKKELKWERMREGERSGSFIFVERLLGEGDRYLTVQFVRFFWKRETNQKAKILRKVDYPLELDVYDLCSEELRQKLQAPRQMLREAENVKFGLNVQGKNSHENDTSLPKPEVAASNSGESAAATSLEGSSSEKKTQLTGIYDLVAVLTHKGRSADSGHYVAWVKQDNGSS
ncbi:Ubiquitin carboxyl-terminal hydrolase 6 [Platanthera guangdongensis]|uniref:ubiquitinyl hydrolase 1 n=1 Tax=Platanthera guangdongensis TaxID=2320717 RepID=A0ABR2M2Y3_9ASPA